MPSSRHKESELTRVSTECGGDNSSRQIGLEKRDLLFTKCGKIPNSLSCRHLVYSKTQETTL